MKRFHLALTCALFAFAASAQADAINDAMVQSLRNQADIAESRAQSARNPADAQRWLQTARQIRAQANAAERRGRTIESAAQKIQKIILDNDEKEDE